MSPNHKNLFISFEGIEGVGKSTHIRFIADKLMEAGCTVCVTREPGGTSLGENLRSLLLNESTNIDVIAELLVLFAARAQHIQEVIKPALAKNQWVLCDRFSDASFAYQGGGRKIAQNKIQILEDLVQGDFKPNYTFLFDAPVEVGLQRIQRRAKLDRFEQEKFSFFESVRKTYLARAKEFPARFRVIDASLPLKVIQKDLLHIFQNELCT